MSVVDLKDVPKVLKNNKGEFDPGRVYAVLGIENNKSLIDLLLYLYHTEPMVRTVVDVKLMIMAISHLEGKGLPDWSLPELDSADFFRADAFCGRCPGTTDKIEVAGNKINRCMLKGADRIIWCEAYRLVLADKPTGEEDLRLLKELSMEAQLNYKVPLGGYVEDPMFEERKTKVISLLEIEDKIPLSDEDFYRIACSYKLDEGLTKGEFVKLYNPVRVVTKYLVPDGVAVIDLKCVRLAKNADKEYKQEIDSFIEPNVPPVGESRPDRYEVEQDEIDEKLEEEQELNSEDIENTKVDLPNLFKGECKRRRKVPDPVVEPFKKSMSAKRIVKDLLSSVKLSH